MPSAPLNPQPVKSRRRPRRCFPVSRSSARQHSALKQPAYDHAIRQLRVCVRVLSAVLIALIARSVVDGADLVVVLSAALIAFLLLASGVLWRYRRRLEPHARANTAGNPKSLS
jgi:hypothetical protein